MDNSAANAGELTLDQCVVIVTDIYSAHDSHRSIWDVWCHALHHAAGIAEQIRRGSSEGDLYKEISDFSLWLFTTVRKLTGKFGQSEGKAETPVESLIRIQNSCSDLLWHKYPGICPICYVRRVANDVREHRTAAYPSPCDCQAHQFELYDQSLWQKRLRILRDYSEQIRGKKPLTIDEWQEMFGTIFAEALLTLSLSDIALHLLEKLGEASDAMVRMYTYKEKDFIQGAPNERQLRLEGQIADVFSWLFGLAEKLSLLKQKDSTEQSRPSGVTSALLRRVQLSAIIWGRYGSDEMRAFYCPFCKKTVCSCPIILVPATRPIEELTEKFY